MAEKKLRIGWSWATPDGWILHRDIKDKLWTVLSAESFDVKALFALLTVKEEWIEIRPEDKIPINYHLYLYIWKRYKMVYRQFKPPLKYRLGINKVGIFILTLYREDSAYCERFGGITQYIIDHAEDWPEDDKEARLLALQDLKNWWYEEDWRARGKDKIAKIFDWVIENYESDEFIRMTVDFWVNHFIANKEKWNRGNGYFEPDHWYPRAKGPVNYLVHGRRS
jgi:hypothetical protein